MAFPFLRPAAMDAGIARGKVWQMAQSPHSTWVLQSVLQDAAGGDAERVQLAHELKGHVWEAMRCPYANHVIQKCLVLVHARANQFMVDELLMEGPGAVVNAAKHRYGCRILQRMLEQLWAQQLTDIVSELVASSANLTTHVYGHFVIACLLERYPATHQGISLAIERNISATMRSRYGRAVVADALLFGAARQQLALARALLLGDLWLFHVKATNTRHMAAITRRMLHLLSEDEAQAMCDSLATISDQLKQTVVGRRLLRLCDRHQPPEP